MNFLMKIFLFILCVYAFSPQSNGQIRNIDLQEKNYEYHEIKIGDSLFNLPLGTVVNNPAGIKNISELKGKLIILDFWNTWCASCIAAFPKMDQLQKRFEGQVQIFLVNTTETEEVIRTRFKKIPALNKIQLPDLASIVNAKIFDTLFPHEFVPYHVWIDGKGIVRFKGSELNTNEAKIKNFLEGKEVDFINEGVEYNGSKPLGTILKNKSSKYSSLITGFTDEVKDFYGKQAFVNKIDSNTGTIRNTYVNRDLAQLYVDALENEMDSIWKKNLNIRGGSYLGKFDLIVKDTIKYTWRFLPSQKWTDEILKKSKFCYEQITPLNISASTRKKYMLEDLNRYFGSLYGVTGVVKTEKKLCYVLIRTSNIDKLKAKEGISTINFSVINGKKVSEYRSYTLKNIITNIIYESKEGINKKDFFNIDDILIDETGYLNSVDMALPYVFEGGIRNLDELKKVLQMYDLDIVKSERYLKTLVIKEK